MSLQTPYSSIDWIAEATRVAQAFGVEGECHWNDSQPVGLHRKLKSNGNTPVVNSGHFLDYFMCLTGPFIRIWQTENGDEYGNLGTQIEANLNTSNSRFTIYGNPDKAFLLIFARALFHLNLLTIEVENALCVIISATEKMEWGREYEERYGVTI